MGQLWKKCIGALLGVAILSLASGCVLVHRHRRHPHDGASQQPRHPGGHPSHTRGRGHGRPAHHHGPGCGHERRNGLWITIGAHVHGAHCGHVLRHGVWVAVDVMR